MTQGGCNLKCLKHSRKGNQLKFMVRPLPRRAAGTRELKGKKEWRERLVYLTITQVWLNSFKKVIKYIFFLLIWSIVISLKSVLSLEYLNRVASIPLHVIGLLAQVTRHPLYVGSCCCIIMIWNLNFLWWTCSLITMYSCLKLLYYLCNVVCVHVSQCEKFTL